MHLYLATTEAMHTVLGTGLEAACLLMLGVNVGERAAGYTEKLGCGVPSLSIHYVQSVDIHTVSMFQTYVTT